MLTFKRLSQQPARFRALTGLTVGEFEQLWAEAVTLYEAAEEARLFRPDRQRRRGAGRKFTRSLPDRLLLALCWLRIYPTYELLGALFNLDKSTVCDWLHPLLALLRHCTAADLRWPDPQQKKRNGADFQADFPEFPELAAIIDATEQRTRRPQVGHDQPSAPPPRVPGEAAPSPPPDPQRPYYSGKKKAHTLKTQIAVTPAGRICSISETVPGSMNDLTLLRRSGTLDAVPGGTMLDSGYQGIQKDRPDQRLYASHRASRGHPLTDEQKADNQRLSKIRIRIEHALAHLKIFQVLAQLYRHRRAMYNGVFCLVAALTNRRRGFQPLVAG
jgi:hypothetical protein